MFLVTFQCQSYGNDCTYLYLYTLYVFLFLLYFISLLYIIIYFSFYLFYTYTTSTFRSRKWKKNVCEYIVIPVKKIVNNKINIFAAF